MRASHMPIFTPFMTGPSTGGAGGGPVVDYPNHLISGAHLIAQGVPSLANGTRQRIMEGGDSASANMSDAISSEWKVSAEMIPGPRHLRS